MATTVTTQIELDAAIAAGKTDIGIDSLAGVKLYVTGSSSVDARGSSRVVARDSSRVVARDSSRVVARDSSSVDAWDSSRVDASKYVAVRLHSQRVALTGTGHIIDLTSLDLNTVADWIDFHGVKVTRGKATVYKAVDADLNAGHGHTITNYPLGGKVVAPDWEETQACGHGLHFGYLPSVAGGYFSGSGSPRFLAVEVAVKDMIALGDKCKAPACKVLFEVDVHGDKVVG